MERKDLKVYHNTFCDVEFITKEEADSVMDVYEARIKELEAKIEGLEYEKNKTRQ